MQAIINRKSVFLENKWSHSFETLECKIDTLLWQEKGLQYTASGYGSKIPTRYKVKHNNRWKRVYCCIYGNSGTLYIMQGKDRLIVDIEN